MTERAIRNEKGHFVKGVSGNPTGRPKEDQEVKNLAKSFTYKAIMRLAELMDDSNGRTAVSACNAILDRGWGKPAQTVMSENDKPVELVISWSDTQQSE